MLLPGLDGTGALFAPLVESLGERCPVKVIAYPHSVGWEPADYVEYVVEQAPGNGPLFLFAESFSGPVGVKVAERLGDRVLGLILCNSFVVSPLPAWLSRLPWEVIFFRPHWPLVFLLLGLSEAGSEMKTLAEDSIGGVAPRVLADRVRLVLSCDERNTLARVKVPTALFQSKSDLLITDNCAEEIRACCPGIQTFHFPGGHLLAQTHPAEVAQKLIGFIEEVTS